MTLYVDCNATVPLLPEVKDYLSQRLNDAPLANPNSLHILGQKVSHIYEKAREITALFLGADHGQLIFNSGASEGISHVFHSLLHKGPQNQKRIIAITEIEHPAIIEAAKFYTEKGFKIVTLPVTAEGVLDFSYFKNWLEQHFTETIMVSIMAANNETGVIQPFEEIATLCEGKEVPFLCDTTQLIGKVPFHFTESKIDFAVFSGHKLGALPGTGGLLCKDPSLLTPLIHGGGQEKGHRSGTQNYLGQETVAIAIDTISSHFHLWKKIEERRTKLESELQKQIPDIVIFGEKTKRLPGTLMFAHPGVHGQALQIELESCDIFVTTSSACSDNDPHPSHVLKAMGYSDGIGRGAIRLSFSPFTKEKEFATILEVLVRSYGKLLKIASY